MRQETVSLWIDLANQLMLAFVIVFCIGILTGYLICWLSARKQTRAVIRAWCDQKRAEYLASGRGLEEPIENHPNYLQLKKRFGQFEGTRLEGNDLAALFQFRDRLKTNRNHK